MGSTLCCPVVLVGGVQSRHSPFQPPSDRDRGNGLAASPSWVVTKGKRLSSEIASGFRGGPPFARPSPAARFPRTRRGFEAGASRTYQLPILTNLRRISLVKMAASRPAFAESIAPASMTICPSLLADFCLRRAVRAQVSSDRQTSPVRASSERPARGLKSLTAKGLRRSGALGCDFSPAFQGMDGLGRSVPQPANVRLYNLASFEHGGGGGTAPPFFPGVTFPGSVAMCLYPTDPTYEGFTRRALLIAWDLWADKGIEPPKSRYPSVRDGTLISLEEEAEAFPSIPGVEFTPVVDEYNLLDFGPALNSTGGIMTILPPLVGPSYDILVPTTDRDGIEIAGVHQVELLVPLGTWTGWNLRAPGHRPGNLCSLSGSFFPFATTKAERLAKGDPRLSLTERYRNHDGFVDAVDRAADSLVRERLLLREDADRYIQAAQSSNVLR